MKITIDLEKRTLDNLPLFGPEALRVLTPIWLSMFGSQKGVYCWSWLGRPIIQLPFDMVRAQETIYRVKPDVIIETGVAHGGSLIYYASLCKMIGKGRVIGIDVEIRPHNRKAIEAHELASHIALVEGSSTAPEVVAKVRDLVKADKVVMVILDSNHSTEHVLAELRAYGPMVTKDSYCIVTDGGMEAYGTHVGNDAMVKSNPLHAIKAFLEECQDFREEKQIPPFNESLLNFGEDTFTYWPMGWLKRV